MYGTDVVADYGGRSGLGSDEQHRLVLDELLQEHDQVLITRDLQLFGDMGLRGRLDARGPVGVADQLHLQQYLVLHLVEICIRAGTREAH